MSHQHWKHERKKRNRASFDQMLACEGDTAVLSVVREDEQHGDGSFSIEALQALSDELMMWIGSRVIRDWNEHDRPPTELNVHIMVDVK